MINITNLLFCTPVGSPKSLKELSAPSVKMRGGPSQGLGLCCGTCRPLNVDLKKINASKDMGQRNKLRKYRILPAASGADGTAWSPCPGSPARSGKPAVPAAPLPPEAGLQKRTPSILIVKYKANIWPFSPSSKGVSCEVTLN